MAGTGNQPTGPRKPGMTAQEKNLERQRKFAKRQQNRENYREERRLHAVATGIAKKVPAYAKATEILANIEDINENLTTYMQAGMMVLGENFPELVQQTVDSAKNGNERDRRFLIDKYIDLKPIVEGGSLRNQRTLEAFQELLQDEGAKVTATERKIEVSRGD